MQADWEFEVGRDAPIIDAHWPGFVDLRLTPDRAGQLPESAQFPALAKALVQLNGSTSPFWSSKCDFWPRLEAGEFDLDEMDAPPGRSTYAVGCYLDLLPNSDARWALPEAAAAACKRLCATLRVIPLECCRVDLVIRRAIVSAVTLDLGITAYLTACGETEEEAAGALEAALLAFANASRCVGSQSTLK